MTLPPLPPGFELVEGDTPPLPPGFEMMDDDGPGMDIDIIYRKPVPAEQFDPSEGMGQYEKYRAGLGRSMVRGAEGLAGLALAGVEHVGGTVEKALPMMGANPMAEFARRNLDKLRDTEAERRRLDAPLMAHPAAMAGEIIGTGAQLAVPGLALRGTRLGSGLAPTTVEGNMGLGTIFGAAQPAVSEEERLQNAVVTGVTGGAAAKILPAIAKVATPAAKQAMARAKQFGINLKGAPGEQVEQTALAAQRGTLAEKTSSLPAVQSGVKAQRAAASKVANDLYDTARGMNANVAIPEVRALANSARSRIIDEGFDLKGLPQVAKRLDELDQMSRIPYAREAKLKTMELWRKRINAMSPKDGSPEQAASTVLKKHYDEWLTGQFNNDMIIGDKQAVAAWREAKDSYAAFKDTFDANKVIRDLARKPDLTTEQMKGWILNANSVGAKRESGAIVARLNRILGADSKEMNGLRAEVLTDITEPMMRPTPDIRAFVKNYDKFLANNPTLKKELFPQGLGDIDDVIKFARGIEKRPGAVITPQQQKGVWDAVMHGLTKYTVGHGIAQGGVRVRAATAVLDSLRSSTVGKAAKQNILREYLGAEPKQAMFRRGAGVPGITLSATQLDTD